MEEQRWAPPERGTEQGTAGERSSYRNTAPTPSHPPPRGGGGEIAAKTGGNYIVPDKKEEKLGQYMQLVERSSLYADFYMNKLTLYRSSLRQSLVSPYPFFRCMRLWKNIL
jgi:hypothetical protein